MREVDKTMQESEIMELLQKCNVLQEGHFVGASGKHLDHYFDKNRIFADPVAFERLCEELAARCFRSDDPIDVVIGPMVGAGFVGQRLAYHLAILQGRPVTFVFAEKAGEDGFVLNRGQDKLLVPGSNALAVEDVITTGGSIIDGAIAIAKAQSLNIVAAATLCNRGKTAADLGIPGPIYSLLEPDWPAYTAHQCPLCADDVPVNTEVGHGADFMAKKRELPLEGQ